MEVVKKVSQPQNVELFASPAVRPKGAAKTAKIRSSITPGTVLILLAGRLRGKRVVFLKQLPSGLLLISGPFKVNGVPLKRVNQAYVIATSTKVDISSVKIPEVDEKTMFKRQGKKNKTDMFEAEEQKEELSPERKALQADFDTQLLAVIKTVPNLRSYLASPFSLKKGQAPHAMKF